jgi:mRNA-degrading endonuclease YafQ of YafQ-DinJ toxin-antitoxin module
VSYRIIYTPGYNKRAARFIRKHPDLIPQYEKTLRLMEIDPFHPSLRLHRLKGRLSELHSVSINISYRITLELVVQGHEIVPIDVGSHDEVYE